MAKSRPHLLLRTFETNSTEFSVTWSAAHWQPGVDIYETPDAILVQVEVPGLDQSNLRLHFDAGQLIIEGRRDRPALAATARCLQVEIYQGGFRRAVPLPPGVDDAGITASYQAGLLLITIPLKEPEPPQNLRVDIA